MLRLTIALLVVLLAVSLKAEQESIHAALSDTALPLKRDGEGMVPSKKDGEGSVPSKRGDDEEVPSMTDAEQQQILDAHNVLRMHEGSSNINKLEWNPTLADMAQGWVKECKFAHGQPASPASPFEYTGQNIYAMYPYKTPVNFTAVTMKWFNEKTDYDFESTKCQRVCGHYTQVVWHDTTDLGCAAGQCDALAGTTWSNALIVVCNYGPAGNWKGEKPFDKGNKCEACPDSCEDGLCKE